MPVADVTLPDGRIATINAPEGATQESILRFAKSQFEAETAAKDAPQIQEPSKSYTGSGAADNTLGVATGYTKGMTLGFDDEAQAAIGATLVKAAGLINPDAAPNTWREEYNRGLDLVRRRDAAIEQASPKSRFIGELAGGVALGAGAAAKMGGTGLARAALANPKTAALGTGALSGSLYGFGSGEGGFAPRLEQAGIAGLAGGTLGVGGAYVSKNLAQRVKNLLSKPKESPLGQSVTDIVETRAAERLAPETTIRAQGAENRAITKVIDRVKQDYPDNWETVLNTWADSDVPLADLAQGRLTSLAKGAAQFPRGGEQAQKFFRERTAGASDRVAEVLPKNNFFETAEDAVIAGREKAAPLYKKAYEAEPIQIDKLPIEVAAAIKDARKTYPSELNGFPDNSVKVLDYAKRVLDDKIGVAKRAGENNFVRSRTGIVNSLVEKIDNAVPAYKEARAVAGDYLSTEKAMMDGLDVFSPKNNSDLIKKNLKSMTDSEKTAYNSGVLKAIMTQAGKNGANPYQNVLGSPEKRKRLVAILPADEFKKIETSLKAEDRLFSMAKEVVGGSPTVSKAMAAADFAAGGQEAITGLVTGGIKGMGLSAINGVVKKAFSGLNDRTAEHVSRLIYETDPAKKLLLLDRVSSARSGMTAAERAQVKKAYVAYNSLLRSATSGATAGGVIGGGAVTQDVPTITIRPKREQQ